MLTPVLIGIAQNVVYLLALALVYDLVANGRAIGGRPLRRVGIGLLIGLLTVGTMLTSLRYDTGVLLDARSVVIAVTGLFFGALTVLPAMALAIGYRIMEGGAGAVTGTLVIAASGGIGLLWRRARQGRVLDLQPRELLLFGVTVHLVFVGLLFTLPNGLALELLPLVGPPVLLLFPLATLLLGMLILRRMRREVTGTRLAESEARYRALFEDSHSIMLIVDPADGEIVTANPSATRFYGHSASRLKSMRFADLHATPEPEVEEAIHRSAHGTRTRFELRQLLADGTIRHVEVFLGPIPIEGRPLLHVIVHDVTEQEAQRKTVQRQRGVLRLLSTALEAAANPIVITDRHGRIEWVNPAFTALTGFTMEEAIGEPPGRLLGSGLHDEAFFEELWETILEGRVWEGEMQNRKKDGTLYHERQTITPVRDREGEITHFIAIKEDLSERMRLQDQLLRAQKMEALGQFAGGIAHDFNNLLTVINGTAQLAGEEADEDSPERAEFRQILEAGLHASRLTRQILTFARESPTTSSPVEVNEVVRSTCELVRRLLHDAIEIDLDLCSEEAVVEADPSRLEQVILNLAVNSQDAMPDGGRITLRTRVDPGGVAPASNRLRGETDASSTGEVVLHVTDTGSGIPPEVRERIFDPFFTTKAEGKGTGLGLATVYGIVTQAGGTISVESEEGEGTTFEIRFPRGSAPRVATGAPLRSSGNSNGSRPSSGSESSNGGNRGSPEVSVGARILIVEDEGGIRRVASRILERAGHEVLTASSGEGALQRLEETDADPDLLITDVVMPGMSGPDLVARLRATHPGLRVLFSSGHSGDTLREFGLDASDHRFLQKPYTLEGLTEAVRAALSQVETGGSG
jgi:two-component system, cell cycle sensor histidine kinase and response regulator CckA